MCAYIFAPKTKYRNGNLLRCLHGLGMTSSSCSGACGPFLGWDAENARRKMRDWKIRHQDEGWNIPDWKMREKEKYETPQVF